MGYQSRQGRVSFMPELASTPESKSNYQPSAFTHLVIIEPLGLLYGSAGRFLSPENLVGRSGASFPPPATTLSGLFAASLRAKNRIAELENLQLAGAFWAWQKDYQNFYVPVPFNSLVKNNRIEHYLIWDGLSQQWKTWGIDVDRDIQEYDWITPPDDKYETGKWLAIKDWQYLQPKVNSLVVVEPPWKFLPHLHPHLKDDERHTVDPEKVEGSLFLENSVQLHPDAGLIYLSNTEIEAGCYRFGGEGHFVDLRCEPLDSEIHALLHQNLGQSFALITPAVWGSNRFSWRAPVQRDNELLWGDISIQALLTQRPHAVRHRFGQYKKDIAQNQPKILSRGRYATPAGTVYVLERSLNQTWQEQAALFPTEGVSLQRWGYGLALPLA